MADLLKLKELIFESDNRACFIERERILSRLESEMKDYNEPNKYAIIFSKLLGEVSTPINTNDYFAGRVFEDLPDEGMNAPNLFLYSEGHMSYDYEKILRVGLEGILKEIKTNSAKKGDKASEDFAKNAEIVITAIRNFTQRYAKEAEKNGLSEMAQALKTVPFEPAYDFYSALQGIWILHMIASCYIGSRDYAFGRFDKYMLPFYEKALKDGKTKEELTELLAGFFVKTNEICGTNTYNYLPKPIRCQSSKQYVNIGGEAPNAFSLVVLDAAKLLNMAQPQIVVLLKPDSNAEFTHSTFEALSVLTDKMNIYNYNSIVKTLSAKGIEEEVAKDFTYSACCTFDLNYHTFRFEHYTPVPQIFVETLEAKEYTSLNDIIDEFKNRLAKNIQKYADECLDEFDDEHTKKEFVLDSLFLSDSATECRYACDGKAKYNMLNVFCPGIATISDSLMVLDKLVFKEKAYSYAEFAHILKTNFENNEELRQRIQSYTKFGNDTMADIYASLAGNAFIDAVESVSLKDNFYIAPGFYSLERDNSWKTKVGATPDGRKAGDPFSENQSPTYGADKNGITSLLISLSKLPFDKTLSGGLNLSFSQKMSPEVLESLVVTYFEMGGLHVGISVVDKDTLKDAMQNPDKYKSLTVRLYGFSEYFVSLPKWQQIAVLNRTDY